VTAVARALANAALKHVDLFELNAAVAAPLLAGPGEWVFAPSDSDGSIVLGSGLRHLAGETGGRIPATPSQEMTGRDAGSAVGTIGCGQSLAAVFEKVG
jgi:acetyl-CoA acetyltransferase